jgi:hypothetical protein
MHRPTLSSAVAVWLALCLLFAYSLVNAQTASPGWDARAGFAVNCGSAGNPACAITAGPGCNTAVAGQCSFPKATAQAACIAHGTCKAITCNRARTDCQARGQGELVNLVPRADFDSFAIIAPSTMPTPGASPAPGTASLTGPGTASTGSTGSSTGGATGGGSAPTVQASVFNDAAEALKGLTASMPGDFANAAEALKTASEATEPGGKWVWRTSGDYTLFINTTTFQTAILLVNRQITIPYGEKYGLTGTGFDSPFFVLSNLKGTLNTPDLPPLLRGVINTKLFGVTSLSVERGSTNFALARIGGEPRRILNKLVGAPIDPVSNTINLSVRSGVARIDQPPPPPPAATPADAFRNWLTSYRAELEANENLRNGTVAPSRKIFVDAQTPPNARWGRPLGLPTPEISDATISWDNTGTIGFIGNMYFGGKRALASYQGPLSVVQRLLNAATVPLVDLADLTFMLATPSTFTLRDFAQFYIELSDKLPLFGTSISSGLSAVSTPLSLFSVKNPKGEPPAYKAGDDAPALTLYNLAFIGPLARYNGKEGPYVSFFGEGSVLGLGGLKAPGSVGLQALISTTGLAVTANANMNINPVPGINLSSMSFGTDILVNASTQKVNLNGSFSLAGAGRTGVITFQPTNISFRSDPTGASNCLAPLTITGNKSFPSAQDMGKFTLADIGSIIDWPDETALVDSVGNLRSCPGYLYGQIKAGIMVGANGIAYGGKLVGQAMKGLGSAVGGAVVSGFDVAGNFASGVVDSVSCKTGVQKCSSKYTPPPEAGVLDAGFYQAANPDLKGLSNQRQTVTVNVAGNQVQLPAGFSPLEQHWLNNGFKEGRAGAAWFDVQYYYRRHPDLQAAYNNDPRKGPTPWPYALWHWQNHGLKEGRRSSALFDVGHYYRSNPDLQAAYAGDKNRPSTPYEYALWHFLNHGYKENRVTAPDRFDPVRDPRMAVLDTRFYLSRYPDAQRASNGDHFVAGVHWLQTGLNEGRQSAPTFDVKAYMNNYPDLQKAFGPTNYAAGVKHWLEFGQREGRKVFVVPTGNPFTGAPTYKLDDSAPPAPPPPAKR